MEPVSFQILIPFRSFSKVPCIWMHFFDRQNLYSPEVSALFKRTLHFGNREPVPDFGDLAKYKKAPNSKIRHIRVPEVPKVKWIQWISRTTSQIGLFPYENGQRWPSEDGVLIGSVPYSDGDHFRFHCWKPLKRYFEIKLSQKCWTIFEVQSDLRFQTTRVWG